MQPLIPITGSGLLKAAGYDPATATLALVFDNKPHITYHYQGVPERLWDAFNAAPSKGLLFFKEIKGKFEFEAVTAAEPQAQA